MSVFEMTIAPTSVQGTVRPRQGGVKGALEIVRKPLRIQKALAHYTNAVKKFKHVATESLFIVFLFYANLLMGEFVHTGQGQSRGWAWAFWNIFTLNNLAIALVAAIGGSFVFETIRRSLSDQHRATDDLNA